MTDEPLSLGAAGARWSARPARGRDRTFQGTTRDVDRLEYEAYREMAEERIAAIVAEAVERHGLEAAAAEHRVGAVPLGEASVAVAASAAHRGEAFAGAREIIDRIKAEAPIWKKEVEGGEERWVEGTRAGDSDRLRHGALRALPSVERLLQTEPLRSAAGAGPRALAVEAARAGDRAPPRARSARGNGGPPAPEQTRRARRRGAAAPRAPALRPGDQRDRRRRPHQPRPRAACVEALEAIDSAGERLLEPRVRPRARGARQPPGARRGAAAAS